MSEDSEGLLGYEELAGLLGKSRGAVRNMRLRGQLPEPDGDGPRWRRSTVEVFLERGGAGSPPGPSTKVPELDGPRQVPARVDAASGVGGPVRVLEVRPVAEEAPPPAVVELPAGDPRQSMTLEEVLGCEHPVGERRRLPYMAWCAACGQRQVGEDRWAGLGYAGWKGTLAARVACDAGGHPAGARVLLASGRGWCSYCQREFPAA